MRIHELVPVKYDVVIKNNATDHIVVLTPQGAVYNSVNTDDLRNMSVAFGLLFTSDDWRLATLAEIDEFCERDDEHILKLEWQMPVRREPHLKLVKNEEEWNNN